MTRAEKRAAVLRAIAEHPDWSARAIADITGVDKNTVTAVKKAQTEASSQIHQPNETGGKTHQAARGEIHRPAEALGDELETHHDSEPHPKTHQPLTSGEFHRSLEGGEIHRDGNLTTVDTIAAQIPRERWLETGFALARPDSCQPLSAELEAIVAEVPAVDRESVGWALVRLFRAPKPKLARSAKPQSKYSEQQRRDVLDLKANGAQDRDIAQLLKLSLGAVKGILHRAKNPHKRRQSPAGTNWRLRYTDEQRDAVIVMRQAGQLYREIGERLGISTKGVKNICAQAGLAKKRSQGTTEQVR